MLMQSSRDCPLIAEHPEWYLLDENGAPRIHQIAWLVYSDVALFDLVYNRPLQEYLLEIAPYWIEQCQLDGVRIDASQTIDRPFLKKIKNRIQASDPQALVLGETLCPLHEARDLPVDMVYALLVDFHRDVEHAGPLIDFIEETNRAFAPGTMALAYFENHDSPRASAVWRERFEELLRRDEAARARWDSALTMALLKNLQAAVIDCSVGSAAGCNMARGLELGSEWGEETRTDFENENLLDFAQAGRPPHAALVQRLRPTAAIAAGVARDRRWRGLFPPQPRHGRRSRRPRAGLRALYDCGRAALPAQFRPGRGAEGASGSRVSTTAARAPHKGLRHLCGSGTQGGFGDGCGRIAAPADPGLAALLSALPIIGSVSTLQ